MLKLFAAFPGSFSQAQAVLSCSAQASYRQRSRGEQSSIIRWQLHTEPDACRYVYEYSNGRVDIFAIYFTPISPGVTRSFFKFVSQNPPKGFSLISKVPQWLFHNLSGSMSDQDAVMLHTQVCGLLPFAVLSAVNLLTAL